MTAQAAELFAGVGPAFSARDLAEKVSILASDAFEGRGPGTPGEERTIQWLAEQFRQAGLQPGGPGGSWFQEVPMVGIRSEVSLRLDGPGRPPLDLLPPQDIVAWAPAQQSQVTVTNSPLVFVGYGVEAPEFGWDDYKGVDVRGRTLLMLVNDPPVEDPAAPGQLDPAVFRGKAMTYYGRWTYKFEVAARKGAAAALVIHETGPAGYPWFVVINSWGRENFSLAQDQEPHVQVAGWITSEATQRILQDAGLDWTQLKRRAVRRDFRPVPLPLQAGFNVTNSMRQLLSRNVVGQLPGSDSRRRNDWIVYTAHWDHLGKDERLTGDQIFNGALDNATGTAGLVELARAFGQLPQRPERSLMFIALTAEEQGLLGARHYAMGPLQPLERTVLNINMDGLNPWGRTSDLALVGLGSSTVDDLVRAPVAAQGRTLTAESQPEKGTFYRSDHFEFARRGVPVMYAKSGTNYLGRPPGWGSAKADEYTDKDYHKVSDEVKPDWDFAGAVEDLQVIFRVGYDLANGDQWPEWNPGTEFRARREASRSAR
jgi:Zn-dependent M28 family amino/carboxypeptidase